MSRLQMEYLAVPNEKKVILDDNDNNIKVIAGPGSGKTTLIIEKIKHLIDKGVHPSKILVITYTNKAADDLQKKIQEQLPEESGFYISTIHGFCTRFIREYVSHFQEYRDYRVLDELSQFLFIVRNINSIKTDDLPYMKQLILSLKNYFGRIKDNYTKREVKNSENKIIQAYMNYCECLDNSQRFDFGDLINVVIKKIQESPELQKVAKEKFQYLFIDEYQDINRMQEELIELFHSPKNKLMVVGDVNQSIYGFRGGDVTIFENFEKRFNKHHKVATYPLRINFRSTQGIIDLSNDFLSLPEESKIIGNSEEDIGIVTTEGITPKLQIYDNAQEEAQEIVKYIQRLRKEDKIKNYADVAILFRSVKNNSQAFLEVFDEANIQYEVVGDGGLFQLSYINALIDCFRQVSEEEDIHNEILGISVSKDSETYEKRFQNNYPIRILYALFENSTFIKNAMIENKELVLFNIGKLTEIISKQQEMFNSQDISRFVEGLQKLHSSFLDSEQLVHKDIDSVKILTLHKAKGLEFPVVFMPGITKKAYYVKNGDLISDLFEHYDALEDLKRAFYVGLTRAKELLVVSHHGKPSEYVEKMQRSKHLMITKSHHGVGLSPFLEEKPIEEELSEIKSSKHKEEVLHLTYYKLIEFWKCQYAYKLRFHHNILIPYSSQLGYGSKVHTLLLYINLAIKRSGSVKWDTIVKSIPDKHLAEFKKQEPRIKNYLEILKKELQSIVKPEMQFEFQKSNMVISGRLDLLVKNTDGAYTIVEFKSGKYKKGFLQGEKDILKNAKEQIELYALAVKKDYDVTKGIVYFFGDGVRKDFKIDRKEMDLKLIQTISEINSCRFEPVRDKRVCQRCVFSQYRICPFNANRKDKVELDEDQEEDFERDSCNDLF